MNTEIRIKRRDTVRVVRLVTDADHVVNPVGMTGTVVGEQQFSRTMFHVRLHIPEGADPRSYPDLFYEEELEVIDHGTNDR